MTDRPSNTTRSETSEDSPEGGSIEELLEEVTGFNFRSVRTLRDLFWRPSRVFSAYVEGERTYTPSLRLWLSMTVVLTVISYFFGGHEDLFANAYANWPEAMRAQILSRISGDLTDLAAVQGDIYGLWHPLFAGLASSTAILLVAFFSGPLRWAARLNITFALTTVGSVVALCVFPLMVQRPDLGLAMFPIMVVAYALTYGRGAKGLAPTVSTWRWVKAVTIGCYVALASIATGAALFVISLNTATARLAVG